VTSPTQLTAADVKKLYAEKKYDEIEAARKDGRLAKVLGQPADVVALLDKARGTDPLTADDVHGLTRLGEHELIVAANRDGRLDHLLGRTTTSPTDPRNE